MTTEHENLLKYLCGVQRIVINTCHGGFGLSTKALTEYKKLAGITDDQFYHDDIDRDDVYLVQVIKDLGTDANGAYAELKIIEVPVDVKWQIEEYDGIEWVAEQHRTWR